MPRRRGTRTQSFGSRGRESHDSTPFYTSRLYAGPPREVPEYVENPVPEKVLDRILPKRSESMTDLPDCSIHLMVTLPPYFVGYETNEAYRRLAQARLAAEREAAAPERDGCGRRG